MRLDEINARLAAIQQEAETASGDALDYTVTYTIVADICA